VIIREVHLTLLPLNEKAGIDIFVTIDGHKKETKTINMPLAGMQEEYDEFMKRVKYQIQLMEEQE